MKIYNNIYLYCITFLITISGCGGLTEWKSTAIKRAEESGFKREVISSGPFSITYLKKQGDTNRSLLVIYIEGDGQAFIRRDRLSPDPTPNSMLTLQLAEKDPNPSIVYLARPCQYLSESGLSKCDSKYWSTHRYSADVIKAMESAIDQVASGYERIALVGYSGGGTIATIIAARRNSVAWFVTIAANLDHETWTSLNQVTPLSGSLNAADFAEKVQHIPQRHFSGARDKVVPHEVVKSFVRRMTNTAKVTVKVIPTFDHECCWVDAWPLLACAENGIPELCGSSFRSPF